MSETLSDRLLFIQLIGWTVAVSAILGTNGSMSTEASAKGPQIVDARIEQAPEGNKPVEENDNKSAPEEISTNTEIVVDKWSVPTWEAVQTRYRLLTGKSLTDNQTDEEAESQLKSAWEQDGQMADSATLQWVVRRVIQLIPKTSPFLESSVFKETKLERGQLYDCSGFVKALEEAQLSAEISADLRLFVAAQLVQREWFDSASVLLEGLDSAQSGFPARLLFYQGLTAYQGLKYKEANQIIDKLLAGETVPIRYRTLGEQMKRDLDNLDPKGLDHVSRRMSDSSVRLADGQTNTKVQEIQDGIVKSLDEQIKSLEEQLQQMQSSSSSTTPAGPAPKEYGPSAGGQAGDSAEANKPAQVLGDADGKNRKEDEWGSLPEKRRDADLQQIQENFPPHYRDIIEQYFKKMAQ